MIGVVVLLALAVHSVSGACWQGWTEYKGFCYSFSEEELNWFTAASTCFYYGARLAQSDSAAKNDWLTAEVRSRGWDHAWIGGTSRHHVPNWEWLPSHKAMTFSNWNPGEPNNSGGVEHCVEIRKEHNYRWNDISCTTSFRFVCERQA